MKITSIEKQKSNTENYNIFIDNVFKLSASQEDIIKNSLTPGALIDEERLERLIESCEVTKAFKYSLRLLERRDYTSNEIENKLRQHSYSEFTVNKIIEKLKNIGFIDDSKFSDRYINEALLYKKHGMRKITYDLRNKGISQEQIDIIEIDTEIEYENARKLAEKKYTQIGIKPNAREKIFRYLVNKGYDFDLVKKVVNEILNNCEEF